MKPAQHRLADQQLTEKRLDLSSLFLNYFLGYRTGLTWLLRQTLLFGELNRNRILLFINFFSVNRPFSSEIREY
jgi:hypothetical protein